MQYYVSNTNEAVNMQQVYQEQGLSEGRGRPPRSQPLFSSRPWAPLPVDPHHYMARGDEPAKLVQPATFGPPGPF